MHYQLITDTITDNIYTKRDIYQQNIKRLTSFRASLQGQILNPFDTFRFFEDLAEQNQKLKAVLKEINELENEAFRYGL